MSLINLAKKSIRIVFRMIIGICLFFAFFAAFYWYNNQLFLWEASLLWPQRPFSESEFKAGSPTERAQMVVDLIQNKKVLGMEFEQVRDLLGPETGDYYHSDSNFTYLLTNKMEASWILTLLTGDDGKIKKAFIRKSCCSISQRIFYLGLEALGPILISLR